LIALCLADLHSSVSALRRLDALLARERYDLVLVAGDITIAGHEPYAKDFIALVRRRGCPLLLVHGNNDTLEAVETFRREGVTIHRRERELFGVRFVGFGGDGTATYDDELAEGESLELDPTGAILLTHLPPPHLRYTLVDPDEGRKMKDEWRSSVLRPSSAPSLRSGHALSATEGSFVQPPSPELIGAPRAQICGHIHQLEGVARLGPTKVIKVRAAMWNRCATLDLRTLRARFRNLGA